MRRTKIICTIGPSSCKYDDILKLAKLGMNIARLNMSHGDYSWHSQIIKIIKSINSKGRYSISILLDTKGPEIRTGDVKNQIVLKKGNVFNFTINHSPEIPKNTVEVNYDGFIKDVNIGDLILVDSGLINFKVIGKDQKNIICECLDGGILTSRRHLNIKGKTAKLPTISKKDWKDIEFGIKEGVDFIALSFVKDEKTINEIKKFFQEKKVFIEVISKIESQAAVEAIDNIIDASDGVMVARGDLGAELPIEEVPIIQEKIINKCLEKGKPVIVATHLLESMIKNPTPTRAEVTDIALAINQRADSIMLSGETAVGLYPFKAISVMDTVARRMERQIFVEKHFTVDSTSDSKMEMVRSACILANNIKAKAIVIFTRRGNMATLVSRCRPVSPVFAFTNMSSVRRKLNLYWGINSLRIDFSKDPEKTISRAINILKKFKFLENNDQIIIVSDILVSGKYVNTIQIRKIQ